MDSNLTHDNTTYCTGEIDHVNIVLSQQRPSLNLYDKYFCFLWFLIGFPGNFLSFFVWIRRKMRPSSGCYLAALALNDFIFLLANIINKINYAWEMNILNVPVVCETYPVIFTTTQYLSLFFVLAFTVERYISVCHPYQRDKYCTMRRAVAVIVGLSVFTLMYHSIQAYVWVLNTTENKCIMRESFISTTFLSIYTMIGEITTFAIVPCVIIIINVRVIVEIKRVNKRNPLLKSLPSNKNYQQQQQSSHSKSITSINQGSSIKCNDNNNSNVTVFQNLQNNNTREYPSTPSTQMSKPTFQKSSSRISTIGNNSPPISANVQSKSSNQSATTVMLLAVSFFHIMSTLPVTITFVTLPNVQVCQNAANITGDPNWQFVLNYWTVRVVVQELGQSHYACNIIFYLLTGSLFRAELKIFLTELFCRPSIKKFFARSNGDERRKCNKTTNSIKNFKNYHKHLSNHENNKNKTDDIETLQNFENCENKEPLIHSTYVPMDECLKNFKNENKNITNTVDVKDIS